MPESRVEMSLQDYRRLALMALWTGMIAALGIVFVFVPNIELVILTAFLAGIALGPANGLLVAVLGEAIFSALNPIGSGLGFPVLFVLQIAGVGLSGLVGGLIAPLLRRLTTAVLQALTLGVVGFLLTLIYDILTALSMPLAAGITEGTLWATLVGGLAFFVMHLVSNTILFAVFGPGLVDLVREQMDIHGLQGE